MALYRSGIHDRQVALPFTAGADEVAVLKSKVRPAKVRMTLADSAKEFKE